MRKRSTITGAQPGPHGAKSKSKSRKARAGKGPGKGQKDGKARKHAASVLTSFSQRERPMQAEEAMLGMQATRRRVRARARVCVHV